MAAKFIEIEDSCCSKWATDNYSVRCQKCGKTLPQVKECLAQKFSWRENCIFAGNIEVNMPYFIKWESGYISDIEQGIEVEYGHQKLAQIIQKIAKIMPKFYIFDRSINGLSIRSLLFSAFERSEQIEGDYLESGRISLFTSCKIKSIQGYGTTIIFCQNYLVKETQEKMDTSIDKISEMCLVKFPLSRSNEMYYMFESPEFFKLSFPQIDKRPIHYRGFRNMKIYDYTDQVSGFIDHKYKIIRENSDYFVFMLFAWEILELLFWITSNLRCYYANLIWAVFSCILQAIFLANSKNTFTSVAVHINIVARIIFISIIICLTAADLRDLLITNSGNTIFVEFAKTVVQGLIGKAFMLLGIYAGKFALIQVIE